LGAVPVPFELSARNNFQPDLDEIAARITHRTRMLLTNSPGNPTGTVYTDEVQRGLAELAVKHDLWVLSDEIYARVIYRDEYISMLRYPGMEERTLIIDGFSKSFAMTGWRLGYTVAPPDVTPALVMMAMNSYTCVAEFTQYAAIDALLDRDGTTPRMVAEFTRRRAQFVRDLNRVPGFKCQSPDGAFYAWVDVTDTGTSAENICRILLEDSGVAAIPGAAFGPSGKDFVRFSFASSVANLQEAVERIMKVSAAWQGRLASR
jgi:aspartate/methionine/tyrosine aminotransferase